MRRVALSLPWFGVTIGVVSRIYRWIVLALLVPRAEGYILLEIAIGVALLCALCATHFANFTLRSWRWRAPALGAFVALGESVMSLALTVAHQERLGHAYATLTDWPSTIMHVLLTRVLVVSVFALVLAAVVAAMRATATAE